ncbi:hypothetical protein CSA56_01410 [candidate division KSB3 bacterium]|uniref:NAD-dependent epimerase/dehydratase domain-containing protein n=1 Tax=candidate division KSB3 bacterium TaxID=2044937 RepID=A0A2G6KKA3_9BACT|nr:MAG: hypothetical protein CSA56_01410 [candidate division KSB3 bacterium]
MNVFVTGASGFVGTHLVKRLVADGHTVYALVRTTSAIDELQRSGVQLVFHDEIHEKSAFRDIFLKHSDIQVVYHLASIVTLASVTYDDYWRSNVLATQHLLDACREVNLSAFVYCSSVGVIGPLSDVPANEESPCRPDSSYGKTKYEAERLALEYYHKYHMPITVIRPAWIYGPGDRRTFTFFRMVAYGRFFYIGDGRTLISPVYVDDVVQALLLGAKHIDRSQGEVFIAAGKESVSLEFLAEQVAREAGSSILPFRIPATLATIVAAACETLCKPLGLEPPIHRHRLDFFFRNQAFDISKIQRTLGYSPQFDVPTGVRQAIRWYKDRGWLK